MPRVKGIAGPYRLFFTSFDCQEPLHVHVERDLKTCKSGSNLSDWRAIMVLTRASLVASGPDPGTSREDHGGVA